MSRQKSPSIDHLIVGYLVVFVLFVLASVGVRIASSFKNHPASNDPE